MKCRGQDWYYASLQCDCPKLGNDKVEVSAVDPAASMMAVNNDSLAEVAMRVREKLKRVIDNI